MPVFARILRAATAAAAILLPLVWACSSTRKPPRVNVALVDEIEKAEWATWPGRDEAVSLELAASAVGDSSAVIRRMAAGFLGRKRPPGAGGVLLERLRVEEDPAVRFALVSTLGRLGTAEAGDALRRIATAEGDAKSRAIAIASLGRLEGDQAVLGAALSSAMPGERLAAGLALARYPAAAQVSNVGAALDSEKDERIRWVLTEALRLCAAGEDGEWSGRLCSLLNDGNFLVSMGASRAIRDLPGSRCLAEVAALAGSEKAPWLARLGAAGVVKAWLERDGTGGKLLDAPGRKKLEELVARQVSRVAAGRIPQAALRRAWANSMLLCQGLPARQLRGKLAENHRFQLALRGVGGPEKGQELRLIGRGAQRLDAFRSEPPTSRAPPFELHSPFRLARQRPPRLCLLAGDGEKVYLELFLSSAPNHVSALLYLVGRGACSGLKPRRLDEPIGILLEPGASGAEPAAGCTLAPELSSRRILRGTVVAHPLYAGGGSLFIAGRPLPEWEGRVSVLGRVLLGQRKLAGLDVDGKVDLREP